MTTDGLYIIEPDRHFPFEDKKFSKLVYKLIDHYKPDGFINLGDAHDFWQISSYDKDPARKDCLKDDIALVANHLDHIESRMRPGTVIHFLEGNHEDRLRRYVWRHARALQSIVPSLPEALDFKGRNARGKCRVLWHPLDVWNHLRIGNTVLHHGEFYSESTAVNNLRKYRGCNFIQGHNHRVQYAHNGDFFSASLGHGALPSKSGHRPAPSDHCQSVGFLNVRKGRGSLEVFTVHHGRAIVRGELFEG